MTAERPELRLVRESLEAVLSPSIVSSVVFEALEGTGGRLPDGPEGARLFVEGALRVALTKRLADDADPIIDDLVRMLAMIRPATATRSSGSRELEITREVFLDDRPVIVFVVSSSDDFAVKMQAALGAARVSAVPTTSEEQLARQIEFGAPQVVLIDAADFAPIEPEALSAQLERLPATTVRALWGADLPFGASVLRSLLEKKIPATPFDRREGIEPLLDLIRSRRVAG